MGENKISGKKIRNLVLGFNDCKVGFEVYVVLKTQSPIKIIGFIENGENNFKNKIRDSILNTIQKKYASEDAEYVSADKIADEQNKLYIISTSKEYNPLSVLSTDPDQKNFSKDDIRDAKGIAFRIRIGENTIWAYQHIWSVMIPNKSKKHMIGRLISNNQGEMFEELIDPVLTITEKVDLLVVDQYIIADDYKLLQNNYGFQDYIKVRAQKAIEEIQKKKLVQNDTKLEEYIGRENGKAKYAKKMMRIAESKVLLMNRAELLKKINSSDRWKEKLKINNNKFVLGTYKDVETLIDLLDERYTRSDITGAEYDTEVKHIAKPVR